MEFELSVFPYALCTVVGLTTVQRDRGLYECTHTRKPVNQAMMQLRRALLGSRSVSGSPEIKIS